MPTTTLLPPPVCLHIPPLSRGGAADVLWDANTGYELDWMVTRESDEGQYTWQNIEDTETDWLTLEAGEYTWQTLGSGAEPAWQPLYRGHGELSGESGPDCALDHAFHSAVIPEDALTVRFRVRSYCGGLYSPYTLSELYELEIPDMPDGPEIGGSVRFDAVTGRDYYAQVNLRDLPGFADSVLALRYPADRLELLAATLESDDIHTDPLEHMYESKIEEVSREPGILRFRCTHEIPAETDLTGLVACFRFTALADGAATVSLG